MKYEITRASRSNIDDVSMLYDTLNDYLESGYNYPRWKKGLYPVRQTAVDATEEGTLFLCWLNGRIAGSVVLNTEQEKAYSTLQWTVEADGEDVLVVRTLTVHPEFMGQGIAQSLLEFAFDFAVQRSAHCIRLDVSVHNTPAIHLYEKMGYVQVGIVDLGLNIPGLEHFYCYELTLKGQELQAKN